MKRKILGLLIICVLLVASFCTAATYSNTTLNNLGKTYDTNQITVGNMLFRAYGFTYSAETKIVNTTSTTSIMLSETKCINYITGQTIYSDRNSVQTGSGTLVSTTVSRDYSNSNLKFYHYGSRTVGGVPLDTATYIAYQMY